MRVDDVACNIGEALPHGTLTELRTIPAAAANEGGTLGNTLADVALHVIERVSNPRLLSYIAAFDVASNSWHALKLGADLLGALSDSGKLSIVRFDQVGWCRSNLSKPTSKAPGSERLKLKCDELN